MKYNKYKRFLKAYDDGNIVTEIIALLAAATVFLLYVALIAILLAWVINQL